MTTLVLGFGNPGRADDGLGPALAEAIAALKLPDVRATALYQLQIEDSIEVAEAEVVIFADATTDQQTPFSFEPVLAQAGADFTTHALSPGALLAITTQVHGATPDAYLFTIRGRDFNRFHEGLSADAQADLEVAATFLQGWIERSRQKPIRS